MQQLTRSFTTLLDLFDRHGVMFLIVGSYASSALAQPRYVKDLDIWLERSELNASRVLAAFHDYGFGDLGLAIEDFTSDTVIELGLPPVLVDLISTGFMRGAAKPFSFADEYARRVEVTIDGTRFPLAHVEHQLEIKRLRGRTQDRDDVESLEQGDPLGRTIEERIREVERLRRVDIATMGDPDRPLPRTLRRIRIRTGNQ